MNDEYMNIALKEAKKAYNENEVPVGAVIIKNGKIISKAHNKKIATNNICDHAELIAIRKATKLIDDWRLTDCIMYVTLEPCPMCASAIQQSRIKEVYIGTKSNVKSNESIITSIFNNLEYNHQVEYYYTNTKVCGDIISNFFSQKRG